MKAEPASLESRAILDEGLHWVTTNKKDNAADAFCSRISKAGFNVIIPNVWHGRGTTWPSDLAPWDDRLQFHGSWDPFRQLLESAAKYRLEVHPWFTVGLRQRDFYSEFATSESSASFDFHNENFRKFISEIILEVVKKYPIQGINVDFLRFDYAQPKHEDEQIEAVEKVIRRVANGARAINSSIIISADTAPWHFPIRQFGQDGPKWADDGLLDVLYSMQYQYNPDFEKFIRIKASMKRPDSMAMIVGNYDTVSSLKKTFPRDPARLVELIKLSRTVSRYNGVAVYLYGMLDDKQIEALSKTVFDVPASPSWDRAKR